jgi:hypothetical protein
MTDTMDETSTLSEKQRFSITVLYLRDLSDIPILLKA